MIDFELSKQDTSALKGIAIIAMLCHHLYGFKSYTGFLSFIGIVGKVCVALFVFCSGYGLGVGYGKMLKNVKTFLKII